jgi:outer membrane protein OmpA-like peptidoglycan-associated protein
VHFNLYFEADSTDLTAASRADLARILDAIRERASVDTSVTGHTDTAGEPKRNYELGLRRAMAVGALLAAAGVDPGLLDIGSHGEANLLVPTADGVAEPRNRRVEVTVR